MGNKTLVLHYEIEKQEDFSFLATLTIKKSRKKGTKIKKLKQLNHKVFKGDENTVTFKQIIPTMNPKYFIIHY